MKKITPIFVALVILALVALPVLAAALPSTTAKGVAPTLLPGNFVASDDDQVCYELSKLVAWGVTEEMRGFKIDPPANFANDYVDVKISTDGKFLDWEIFGAKMLAVIVKGGPSFNLFDYFLFNYTDDQGLFSPAQKGKLPQISHYNVCYLPKPPVGAEGCTPGYWRNHADRWVGVASTDTFDQVFGVTSSLGSNYTLAQAIWANGGGEFALARHATAALLNAYGGVPNADDKTVAYPLTAAEVIAAVQAAYAVDGDIEGTKDMLAMNNELGCPLSGTEAVKVK